MHPYFEPLIKKFEDNSNSEKSFFAEKYMRNKFRFYGLTSSVRRNLMESFIKEYGLPHENDIDLIIRDAWDFEYRDLQYSTMEIFYKIQKKSVKNYLYLIEFMICNKSWWDATDFIAPKIVADYFDKFPQNRNFLIDKWIKSENIWLQRTCIIFQLNKKQKTDVEILKYVIEKLIDKQEFFIQKAIGWSLRQYARTNPEFVKKFVNNHKLSNLAEKGAMKRL